MKKIFRFLYDFGLFGILMFAFSCIFLMGIMWNRHYVGFWFIQDTYAEEKVVIERRYSNIVGSGAGPPIAEVFINELRVVFALRHKKNVPVGESIAIWYSPEGCEAYKK